VWGRVSSTREHCPLDPQLFIGSYLIKIKDAAVCRLEPLLREASPIQHGITCRVLGRVVAMPASDLERYSFTQLGEGIGLKGGVGAKLPARGSTPAPRPNPNL
jgi:hypothetical protein